MLSFDPDDDAYLAELAEFVAVPSISRDASHATMRAAAEWLADQLSFAGGRVVAAGTPEEICEVAESVTGQYLKPLLRDLKARPLKAPPLRLQAVGSLDPSAGPDAIRTRSAGGPRR